MNRIPFKATLRVVPERGSGKRLEIWRSREKISGIIQSELEENFAGNLADSGGGVQMGTTHPTSLSGEQPGLAHKPQFGEAPDELTIIGFYDHANSGAMPYEEKTIIHANSVVRGPASGGRGYSFDTEPSQENRVVAADLKDALVAAVTSFTIEVTRLEVAGVKYGWGSHHLPN